jgi:hypothetical protein
VVPPCFIVGRPGNALVSALVRGSSPGSLLARAFAIQLGSELTAMVLGSLAIPGDASLFHLAGRPVSVDATAIRLHQV